MNFETYILYKSENLFTKIWFFLGLDCSTQNVNSKNGIIVLEDKVVVQSYLL